MNVYYLKTVLAAIIIVLVMPPASCFLPSRSFDEEKWRVQVESADPALLYAPHLRDGLYFNPWMPMRKGFIDFLRWQLSEKTPHAPGNIKMGRGVVIYILKKIKHLFFRS